MLTSGQLATLKAAIQADSALLNAYNAGSPSPAVVHYSATSDPAFYVWKQSLSVDEIKEAIDWAEYAVLTVAKQNAYVALTQGNSINPSNANIRGAFTAIFTGTTNSLSALAALAKRVANRGEALFATGTGTELSPATCTFVGTLHKDDVHAAMRS